MDRQERDRLTKRLAQLKAMTFASRSVEEKAELRVLQALLHGSRCFRRPKLCTAEKPASKVKTIRLEPWQIDQWLEVQALQEKLEHR